jgi:hypothetical protein
MIPVFLSQLLTQISSIEEKKVETVKQIQAITEHVYSKPNTLKVISDGVTPRSSSSNDIYDWLRQENLINENQYNHLKSKKL